MSSDKPEGIWLHDVTQRKLGICCFCNEMLWAMELPSGALMVHIAEDAQGRRVVKLFPCHEYTQFWQRNYWQAWEDKLTDGDEK